MLLKMQGTIESVPTEKIVQNKTAYHFRASDGGFVLDFFVFNKQLIELVKTFAVGQSYDFECRLFLLENLVVADIKKIDTYSPPKKTLLNKSNGKGFRNPTIEDIEEYIENKGMYNVDPAQFFNYYESTGWKNITNWQARVKSWAIRSEGYVKSTSNPNERQYTSEEIDALFFSLDQVEV